MDKIWNTVTSSIPFCVKIMRHCKVMHRITLITSKTFSYYLSSAESWDLHIRLFYKVILWFVFQGLQNFVLVHENVTCQLQTNEILVLLGFLTVHCEGGGCQMQCNTQLRASLFSAKIRNERFNVIAKCVRHGVLSRDYNVQPLSRWLFHDSATLFSCHPVWTEALLF